MVRFISSTVRAMMKLKSHWVAAAMATLRARRRAVGISLFASPLSALCFPFLCLKMTSLYPSARFRTYLTRIQQQWPQPNWKKHDHRKMQAIAKIPKPVICTRVGWLAILLVKGEETIGKIFQWGGKLTGWPSIG